MFLQSNLCLFYKRKYLHHENHILGQIPHSAEALCIHGSFAGLGTVDLVPVGGGSHGHGGDGEILVQHIHGSSAAAPTGADHSGTHLHPLVDVTGGMVGKIKELLYLADLGIESKIINAEVKDNIFKVLENEDVKGTVISRGN